jgi:hypothetical protein
MITRVFRIEELSGIELLLLELASDNGCPNRRKPDNKREMGEPLLD